MTIKLIQGDCLEKMKDIPDGNINLTVTSPPYDNLRTYNGNNASWGKHVWKAVIKDLFRVTKQGGGVVWVVGDATIKGSETGTSFKQALWAKDCGFNIETMVWKKQTFTDTGSLRVRYGNVFEYMFIWMKGKTGTFNPLKDRKNKTNGIKHGTVRQPDGSLKPMSSKGKKIREFGQRFNVWEINTEVSNSKRCHPAQFPEQIAHDHILSWSNEGDTILDPFMGSGTTGVVCKKLNRNFIGIELDTEYFKIAEKRTIDTNAKLI